MTGLLDVLPILDPATSRTWSLARIGDHQWLIKYGPRLLARDLSRTGIGPYISRSSCRILYRMRYNADLPSGKIKPGDLQYLCPRSTRRQDAFLVQRYDACMRAVKEALEQIAIQERSRPVPPGQAHR